MNKQGYYIYFEKQNKTENFPKIEEINNDLRFKLIEKIKNIEDIYIYKFYPIN